MRKIAILSAFLCLFLGNIMHAQVLVGSHVRHTPFSAAAGGTGRAIFYELSASGENFFSIQASDAMAADNPYTWPNAYPAGAGYALTSGAAGAMSWTLIGGGVAATCTALNAICFGNGTNAVGDVAFLSWDDAAKQMIVGGPTANEVLTVQENNNLVSFPFGLYNANVSAFTGVGQRFRLKSSTGVIRNAATWQVQWLVNTNGAETSTFSLIGMNAGAFSTVFQIEGLNAYVPVGGMSIGFATAPPRILSIQKSDAGAGMALARTAVARISNIDGTVGDFAGVAFHHFASDLVQGMIGTVTTSGVNNGLGDMVFGVKASSAAADVTEYARLVGGGYWKFTDGTGPGADPANAFNFWSTGGEWLYRSALASEGAGGTRRLHNRGEHSANTGAAYTFTAALAFPTIGGSNVQITLPTTGVYRIEGRLTINKVGATTANETLFVVLRNSNTGINIENGVLIDLGVGTTLTQTFETITWSFVYTQNTAGEVIKIAGNLSALPAAGTIQASEGYIQYVRLF